MDKFGRNYTLYVWPKVPFAALGMGPPSLTISYPFTLEIEIEQGTLARTNNAKIRIYNLAKTNRNILQFNIGNVGQFQQVQLNAGYGTNPPVIFVGNITQAYSVREGVNFITQIEANSIGYAQANATFNGSFPAGTPYQEVVQTILNAIPGASVGAIGELPGKLTRQQTFSGNPVDIMREITTSDLFAAGGKVNVLGPFEYIPTPLMKTISAASGLLNTPRVEQTKIYLEMLFEPSLHAGEAIKLVSATNETINGVYKVLSVNHRGTFSGAVCGEAITTAEFMTGQTLTPAKVS